MSDINFGSKALMYEEKGLVQKATSEILLKLLSISGQEDVLDLGCGPGGVTQRIAAMTSGQVVGVDVSPGMIEEALVSGTNFSNLNFMVRDASQLGFSKQFDLIYSNSAFQWFDQPNNALQECYNALKPGGRMGIQAPATSLYCPVFIAAVEKAVRNPVTAPIFESFTSPWFFLESTAEYSTLFEDAGFSVQYSRLIQESNRFTPEEVFGIFQSGAENGYLNQAYYSLPLSDDYIQTFRKLVKETIHALADQQGMVELTFTRVYLVARK
ncbi:MAG TPA: methyltransferase domain-containing protein [Syntrophomonadaceae bacterium]|nr:methyltransferase domain-containing protein [Syntrophomonadaceae bacterium]